MSVRIVAVFEAPWFEGAPPWPWPIAEREPFSWIPLSAESTDAEVGSFFARLVTDNSIALAVDPSAILDAVVAEEELVMPGGLSIQTFPMVFGPGCCCGLEGWREWVDLVTHGTPPWLGHDPWPWAERVEDQIRVWADGGSSQERTGTHVDLERSFFIQALHAVRVDLVGFLDRAAEWSISHSFPRSRELAQRLDTAFQIRAPIPPLALSSAGHAP
jgi:hypothetical protein